MGRRVDLIAEDDRWAALGLKPLAKRAVKATCAALGLGRHRVSLLACDDARIAGLNARFRGKPTPTNVLSWPAVDLSPGPDGACPALPKPGDPLGDIAIAWETCTREAADQGKSLPDHVTHLLVHSVLHLLGYDHEGLQDAARMEGLEVKILASIGVSDPYH